IAGLPPAPTTPLIAIGTWNAPAGTELYLDDNAIDDALQAVTPFDAHGFDPRVGSPPVSLTGIQVLASSGVEALVTAKAGARPSDRDAVDTRIVSEVSGRTGAVRSSQDHVGGWPTLAINPRAIATPSGAHTIQASGYTGWE